MIGDGQWGDNAPEPNVKQALYLSHTRGEVPKKSYGFSGITEISHIVYDERGT